MNIFDTYVGNTDEDNLDTTLADADVETVTIDEEQSRRSRFRTETDDGTEVGVVIGRRLQAGDVLTTGEADDRLLLVALAPIEALVVDLADAGDELPTAVALGHAAGNRHWDMAIRDKEVLFPATESEERMLDTVEPHLPDGATLDREMVPTALFDDRAAGHGSHSHDHDGQGHNHADDQSLSKFGGHEHHHGSHRAHEDAIGPESDPTDDVGKDGDGR